MLTSFGIFWGSEGAGIQWPGKDAALFGLVVLIAGMAFAQIAWLKRHHSQFETTKVHAS